MTLWEWAAKAWRAEGVELAALDLQDAQGQNIPLLLWAGWSAATGRALDEELIEAACDTARSWEGRVTGPLRDIRRSIKHRIPDMDDAARETIRADIKAIEVAAERRLLEALELLSPREPGAATGPLPALIAVSRQWSEVTPRNALKLLAERLPA